MNTTRTGEIVDMELENQLTSLELSKRLKELGVKQNAVYHYYLDTPTLLGFGLNHKDIVSDKNKCSAFSVAELGELLPAEIKKDGNTFSFVILKISNFICGYKFKDNLQYSYVSKNEADARANMLISLIENKLIKL